MQSLPTSPSQSSKPPVSPPSAPTSATSSLSPIREKGSGDVGGSSNGSAGGEPSAMSPPPVPRLRRGSTFQSRPVSTPVGGIALPGGGIGTHPPGVLRLRRGASYVKPSTGTAGAQPVPTLQRGGSFYVPNESSSPMNGNIDVDVAPLPRLRRGSTKMKRSGSGLGGQRLPPVASAPSITDADELPSTGRLRRRSSRMSTSALPRAGTFAAFGAPEESPRGVGSPSSQVRRASSADKLRAGRTCGMCSACGSGPPWAPERLKTLSAEEQEVVLAEMRAKVEMGRLEAELRAQRVQDMAEVGRRLEGRRRGGELVSEDGSASASATVSEDTRGAGTDGEQAELESVDLGDDSGRPPRNLRRKRSRAGGGGNAKAQNEHGDDISGPVPVPVNRRNGGGGREPQTDDCGFCESLEAKVGDLEQQLDVLKEVVQWCCDQEEVARKEVEDENALKRNKTWMDKLANAYYGNPSAAGERSRLKEEVDVLRKATDFLFQKLQPSSE